MISTASHKAQLVLQTHPVLSSYTHCAPMLLGGSIQAGATRSPLILNAMSDAPSQAKTGSARRKLWELSSSAACPVTGVCFHFQAVQKMARKVGKNVDTCPDYDLHCLVLQECRSRSPLAELVQRELDRRFALAINQSLRIKTTEALAHWWDVACEGSDWAGEFWAVLTHPRCSAVLEEIVLGQVHMLQHQDGMAARSDASKLTRVLAENHRLTQDLAAAQQRIQTQAAEQVAAMAALRAECMRLRASVIRAKTERDLAQTQCGELKKREPDLLSRQRLVEDNQRLTDHNEKLLMRALRREVQVHDERLVKPTSGLVDADAQERQPRGAVSPAIDLKRRSVLCVGGRTSGIPVYRKVIEDRGASFTHHDGGEEDKASRLNSQLQAADVVICQVGCISHDAYWRVKEHCKRTGKPCLFVEMSGRSALERALGQGVNSTPKKPMPLSEQLNDA